MLSCSFHDPPPSAIYSLSLHDALPISARVEPDLGVLEARRRRALDRVRDVEAAQPAGAARRLAARTEAAVDRKSTRLNSSHLGISYAVFCLKKKKQRSRTTQSNLPVIR